jgi:hypothetical protein
MPNSRNGRGFHESADRRELDRALRDKTLRADHVRWEPAGGRPNPGSSFLAT